MLTEQARLELTAKVGRDAATNAQKAAAIYLEENGYPPTSLTTEQVVELLALVKAEIHAAFERGVFQEMCGAAMQGLGVPALTTFMLEMQLAGVKAAKAFKAKVSA